MSLDEESSKTQKSSNGCGVGDQEVLPSHLQLHQSDSPSNLFVGQRWSFVRAETQHKLLAAGEVVGLDFLYEVKRFLGRDSIFNAAYVSGISPRRA
ncbi:unnamed protein product [Linum trigynum]|uniref:Uncharacterized protein n=1 Tax=Linum trigynum TaxID=586398 RepID=A0AAV2DQB5_9ROSI